MLDSLQDTSRKGIRRKTHKVDGGAPVDLLKLGNALRKDLSESVEDFWKALKTLTLQKFPNTEASFRRFSSDNNMKIMDFLDLCKHIGLPFSNALLRQIFETRISELNDPADSHPHSMTEFEFQGAMMFNRIDRIKAHLQVFNTSMGKSSQHVDSFVRHLALHCGEEGRRLAVLRFQRKLNLNLWMKLGDAFAKWAFTRMGLSTESRTEISCDDFLRVVNKSTASTMQDYELDFLANIFDRVDRYRRGLVDMCDLSVALIQLGTIASRYEQAGMMFSIFDDDNDGCLTGGQILKLYCSTAIHSAVARGDQSSYDADLVLGEELSLAKARRLFEYTQIRLKMGQGGNDDLCTFQEWWAMLEGNENLLEDIVPGGHSIMWVLRPVGAQCIRFSGGANAKVKAALDASKRKNMKPVHDRKKTGIDTGSMAPLGTGFGHGAPSIVEKFRIQAAVRFRHALRGEWDQVDALDNGPPGTAEMHNERSGTLLPSMSSGNLASTAGSDIWASFGSKTVEKVQVRATMWNEAVNAFGRRQRQGAWQSNHRDTLTDWSSKARAARRSAEAERSTDVPFQLSIGRLGNSRSLPSIRGAHAADSLETAAYASTPEDIQSSVNQLTGLIKNEAMAALQDAPQSKQKLDRSSLQRINLLSQVRAANASAAQEVERPGRQQKSICKVHYHCKLCQSEHESSMPHDAVLY